MNNKLPLQIIKAKGEYILDILNLNRILGVDK